MKALAQRGGTADSIVSAMAAIGVQVSQSWILKRFAEWRGPTKLRTPKEPPAPRVRIGDDSGGPSPGDQTTGTVSPEPADLSDADPVERLIADAMQEGEAQRKLGNVAAFATLGRLVTTLREHQRKAKPPDLPNPDDSPDMVALGEQVEKRFLKFLDDWNG